MTEQVTFQLRRGNSSGATGWTTVNPVLVSGEPGFELDTTTLKIGDGSTTWNNLNTLKFGTKVAIGSQAGQTTQDANSVAIGSQAGQTTQQPESVAIGYQSGQINQQSRSVAIGYQAGQTGQIGSSVAIGKGAGQFGQKINSVALGVEAGNYNQGGSSVAIGNGAGYTGQKDQSVAIGNFAGYSNQGAYSIAIGYYAGYNVSDFYGSQPTNSIILNASGSSLVGVSGQTGLYVKPIRSISGASTGNEFYPLSYNPVTGEITIT
jgi:hypothetical protein